MSRRTRSRFLRDRNCIRDLDLAGDWFWFTVAQYIRLVVADLVLGLLAFALDHNEA